MSDFDFGQQIYQEHEKEKRSTLKPNILILGETGAGKSSLINQVFGEELAITGVGQPVTREIKRFAHEDTPVVLYDTEGYEIGQGKEEEFFNNIRNYLRAGSQGEDIHVAWYCIQASSHRITDFDSQAIQLLIDENVPVSIVLTKSEMISDSDAEALRSVASEYIQRGNVIPFFEVGVEDPRFERNLEELCSWTYDVLPQGVKRAFAAAQKRTLEVKLKECREIIKTHVAIAGTIAVVPIPLSDSIPLLGNQATMVGRIVYVFGLKNKFKKLGNTFITTMIGRLVGRLGIMFASSLAKFIPGLGSVINAVVATTITYSLGHAFVALCEYFAEIETGELGEKEMLQASEILEETFKQVYAEQKSKS